MWNNTEKPQNSVLQQSIVPIYQTSQGKDLRVSHDMG